MIFKCPICINNSLNETYKTCSVCNYSYEEFIDYNEYDYKYNEFKIDELNEFNKKLKKSGSISESMSVFTEHKDWIYRYIFDSTRSRWLNYFKEYIGSTSLDIGCGFGNNTRFLCGFSKKVYGFDITEERLTTLSLLNQSIVLAKGNIFDVKIESNSVDTVLLIGVLEWLGDSNEGAVETIQKDALKRIKYWLKDEGYLIFAIENRCGLQYFLGAPDHGSTKFTPLMPRKIADLYKRLFYGSGYRTYTYSYHGYIRILKEVGFRYVDFYLTFPNYRYPEIICKYDDGQFLRQHLNSKYGGLKGFLVSKLLPSFFAPSFFLIASKNSIPKNSNTLYYKKGNTYYIDDKVL